MSPSNNTSPEPRKNSFGRILLTSLIAAFVFTVIKFGVGGWPRVKPERPVYSNQDPYQQHVPVRERPTNQRFRQR